MFAATSNIPVQRISGTDAIGTSIAVSQTEFPKSGSAKAVVLARADFFSDALAGGPLAAKVGGPLLFTPGASLESSLDPMVQAEIQRVLAPHGTVYILGGSLALSPDIDTALQALGYTTKRIAGSDEYATAVDIAEQLGNPSTVFEATGTSFADALSAVPAAIKTNGAILLTDGNEQAPETAAYLAAHPSDTRYAIGGPLAAYGADPTAIALYGTDVYGTSVAVASAFFPTAKTFGAATSTSYPEALSGGEFLGAMASAGPLLLVGTSGPLPTSVSTYLSSAPPDWTAGYVFGDPTVVGNDVLSELESPQAQAPQAQAPSVQPAQDQSPQAQSPQAQSPSAQTPSAQSPSAQTPSAQTPSAQTPQGAPLSLSQATALHSGSWSGYVTAPGPFTAVSGTFNVPSPVGASAYMGEWVGIDGYNETPLIQAGVAEYADPDNPGEVIAQPWWEILPTDSAAVYIPGVTVNTGDTVTVSISEASGSEWAITLTDDTNGQSYTTDQPYTGPGSSAEWIVEAPLASGNQTSLPVFSPDVVFSGLRLSGNQKELGDIAMVQGGRQVATPSALSGSGFSVAFGPGPPPAP